jgi:hypothetical protein
VGRNSNTIQSRSNRFSKHLLTSSIVIFFLKFLIILNLPFGAWLGADGESYIEYAKRISEFGLFAKGIVYWPAGYPIIIWITEIFSNYSSFFVISILQTMYFSFAVWYFAKKLYLTKVNSLSLYVFYFITLNPTLSLTSISIGYESICASSLMLFTALFLRDSSSTDDTKSISNLIIASLVAGLASSLQPRLMPGFIVSIILWILFKFKKPDLRKYILKLILSLLIFSLLPLGLVVRNFVAEESAVLSANLGVNMVIGAGSNASGNYGNGSPNIECGELPTDEVELDRARTRCALDWYLNNPVSALKLTINKSTALWSPWWGPLAAGTMARNPYLEFHPVRSMISTQEQLDFVIGPIGKGFAWMLILGNWILLILGLRKLFLLGSQERFLAYIAGSAIVGTWLVTLITFGDHRFRLPIMPLSLLLALVGFFSFQKNRFNSEKR